MGLANCGGLKFNAENFKIINNVLTLKDKETITSKFVAPMCGGILLDGDVFESFYINGKKIIGKKGVTPTEYIVSNCSLLFDESKFEINQYGEISSKVAGLKFTAISVGSTIKMVDTMESDTPSFNMEYSIDDGDTWNEYNLGTTITLANVNDSVLFRGDNPNGLTIYDYDGGTDDYIQKIQFIGTGKIACSKNIMYLIDKNGKRNDVPLDCFCWLFQDDEQEGWLVSAPELPATTLADSCYDHMFDGCTSLTQAPELPAITLANYCYNSMFVTCSSLTQPPELPATTLADGCYESMFAGCSSLTQPPELPATTLADGCYESMFDNCSSLIKAPELPATILTDSCYKSMFDDCSSLTQAPELPSTTLTDSCYYEMFAGCSSLIKAPELPATALTEGCYNGMFYGCSSLTQPPELPATTLADGCYNSMFYECTSLTKAPELPSTTLTDSCYALMFYGCTSLNNIKIIYSGELPTEINATDAWMVDVSQTGDAYFNGTVTDGGTENSIPSGWTTHTF